MKRFKDLENATGKITKIIDFYNHIRPHMSNGMLTPYEMRRQCGR